MEDLCLQGLHFGLGLALDLLRALPGLLQFGLQPSVELVDFGLQLRLVLRFDASTFGFQLVDFGS